MPAAGTRPSSEVRDAARPMRIGGRVYDLAARTYLMGILNVTPDSFSGDGLDRDVEEAVAKAVQMVDDGADVIDVGGESTRPGADALGVEDELGRVIPVIQRVSQSTDCPISIDTYKPEVARAAIEAGASMINDIYGLRRRGMIELAAQADVPVVIMHMKGTPKDMQAEPSYEVDVVEEIGEFLLGRAHAAEAGGVPTTQIVIDPGIGFGKTREHNLQIMRRLPELVALGYPVLLGTSRKSFIGLTLDLPPEKRVEGTAATVAYGIAQGASIVRVHDVRQMARVAGMTDAMVRA